MAALQEYQPQSAYLKWQVVDEQKAFGCPPNRGSSGFRLKECGLRQGLLCHRAPKGPSGEARGAVPPPQATCERPPLALGGAAEPPHEDAGKSLAWLGGWEGSETGTEDDLLYMRSLPTFNEMLRPSDSEAGARRNRGSLFTKVSWQCPNRHLVG